MIVLDASAALELLLARPLAPAIARTLEAQAEIHVPEHFHVEAIATLRRLRMHGGLSEQRAHQALRGLARLRTLRYPVLALTEEVWALRNRLTAYDAAYLALAARLDAKLLTTDRGLQAAARTHDRLAEIAL